MLRGNDSWPPEKVQDILPTMREWGAWWAGDTESLGKVYAKGGQARRPSAEQLTGIRGFISRMFFWGRQSSAGDSTTGPTHARHVPIAGDIARKSAELLFSEPPTFEAQSKDAQARLDALTKEQGLSTLMGAAESCAALGGVYLRATWDPTVVDHVFITRVDADCAIPVFRWGHLTEVEFWHTLTTPSMFGSAVFRHIERHFLDSEGNGCIQHTLFQGAADRLGTPIPLTEHEATAGLVASLGEHGYISTETPGLAVTYVPNRLPGAWRNHPTAQHLGRSDFDGIEGLMDALDEIESSLMTDYRLGKGRISVPQDLLTDNGPGSPLSFSYDRDVYVGLNTLPSSGESAKDFIVPNQFEVRQEQHEAGVSLLARQIYQGAGYSPASFSEDGASTSGAKTATEVVQDIARTLATRDAKIALWKPALETFLAKALDVDHALFGHGESSNAVVVTFPDAVQKSMLELANEANAMGENASTRTKVKHLHPDWEESEIDAEVERIEAERRIGIPADPLTFDRDEVPSSEVVPLPPLPNQQQEEE